MSKKKKQKVRLAFRKNRGKRKRANDLTREVHAEGVGNDEHVFSERLSGKGELTRYRTVIGTEHADGEQPVRAVAEHGCLHGRVIAAVGLNSLVQAEKNGERYECTVRRVVRTLARDSRNAVVTGDRVLFRPLDDKAVASREKQGVIERVEPRFGTVSRWSHGAEHLIVANVERAVIVVSAVDPPIKRNLIDRFLVSSEHGGVRPILCINKIDLMDPAELQPLVGEYSRLGYDVVLTSAVQENATEENATTARTLPGRRSVAESGLAKLRRLLQGRESVFAGQSGVGKSSLLNALQPKLELQTGEVSDWTRKGKHTTRRAVLIELEFGGWVVDTPGIRQFRLWDVQREQVEGFFVEFRPFVTLCKFPDCSHTHEISCGVKQAVEKKLISTERYEGYLRILDDDET